MEQIFRDNPNLDVCYKTSDGKYFYLRTDAVNYATRLKDKKVEKLLRPQSSDVTEVGKGKEKKTKKTE